MSDHVNDHDDEDDDDMTEREFRMYQELEDTKSRIFNLIEELDAAMNDVAKARNKIMEVINE